MRLLVPASDASPFRFLTHRLAAKVTICVALVVGGLLTWWMLERTYLVDSIPPVADSLADWLVTRAFFDGLDPYTPINELADRYDVSYRSPIAPETPVHPRLPGALLVQAPMLLTDAMTASRWIVGLSVASVIGSFFVVAAERLQNAGSIVAFMTFGFLSGATTWAFIFVTQSPLITLIMAAVAVLLLRKQDLSAGVLLGIAGTLKLFPLLLLVPLLARKRTRALGGAILVFAILNLAPLLTHQLDMAGVVEALRDSVDAWYSTASNISLTSWFFRSAGVSSGLLVAVHAVALIGGLILVVRGNPIGSPVILGVLTLAILVSPLAWAHYILLLLPLVLLFATDPQVQPRAKVLAVASLLPFMSVRPTPWYLVGMVGLIMSTALSVVGEKGTITPPTTPLQRSDRREP